MICWWTWTHTVSQEKLVFYDIKGHCIWCKTAVFCLVDFSITLQHSSTSHAQSKLSMCTLLSQLRYNASFENHRCTTELKADLTTPEARVPTASRFSDSGNCCSLYGHELLHGAQPACPTSHVLQVEVVVAGCRRAKFFVDCTGGNSFCAYTLLTSNSTTRTRTGVRTLCKPEHMVWEIAIKKCNSGITFKKC